MSNSVLRFFSAFILLLATSLSLLLGTSIVWGNQYSYVEAERGRRTMEKAIQDLETIDRGMKESARRRYSSTDDDDDATAGVICCVAAVLIIAGVYMAGENQKKERLTSLENAKVLRENAIAAGFSIDDETKECPACAEKIKLKANTCRYCGKKFSFLEMEQAIQDQVDVFMADHKDNYSDKSNKMFTVNELKKRHNVATTNDLMKRLNVQFIHGQYCFKGVQYESFDETLNIANSEYDVKISGTTCTDCGNKFETVYQDGTFPDEKRCKSCFDKHNA
ncbi:zinc ribbon domain-containing protein [Patescibacteria group bacterium]|nr:zinc ribbon domain-containing protein [Patescibacteria group bacterium]